MVQRKQVSLLFFWPELQRQVRIEGWVEKLPAEDSDEYFASRPRGSRLGALASPQSQVIADRAVLEERLQEVETSYDGQEEIPRPAFWGGYQVSPMHIEFWQGRSNRLHDRIAYVFQEGAWQCQRLAP